MAVELPEPDRRPLEAAALEIVVCQLRFDEATEVESRDLARDWFELLGGNEGALPRMSPVRAQSVAVDLDSGVAPIQSVRRGWRFASPADDVQLTLVPNSITLEARAFRSWDAFGQIFESAIRILDRTVRPAIEERLGLRFVNRFAFDNVDEVGGWEALLHPAAMGLGAHPVLGSGVVASESKVVVNLGDETRGTVRIVRTDVSPPTYVVDIDAYVERKCPFVAEQVVARASTLNDRCVSLFQQVALAPLLERLGQGRLTEGGVA